MDIIKYRDMAYNNEKGKRWNEILTSPDVWSQWEKHAGTLLNIRNPKEAARMIRIYATWYLGYSFDLKQLERCALKLRRPPAERTSPRVSAFLYGATGGSQIYRVPMEFKEFDDFLEHYVRPLI